MNNKCNNINMYLQYVYTNRGHFQSGNNVGRPTPTKNRTVSALLFCSHARQGCLLIIKCLLTFHSCLRFQLRWPVRTCIRPVYLITRNFRAALLRKMAGIRVKLVATSNLVNIHARTPAGRGGIAAELAISLMLKYVLD